MINKPLSFIAIVTVLFNSDEVLQDFFESLSLQKNVHFRLYVIDNGKTDSGTTKSKLLARTYGIDAVFKFNNENVGVAKGNNQGIELALADGCTHVLLANNDTQFHYSTISTLMATMQEHADLAATPKIMYHSKPNLIWYAGGHINDWTARTAHYGDKHRDVGQFDHQYYVNYAPTCFMLFDRKIFDIVGMMDEKYFVYSDDTDFVWRMNAQSIRIRFAPTSIVMHKVSTSTGGANSLFSTYYTNRNRIYFIRKNFYGLKKISAIIYALSTRLLKFMLLSRDLRHCGYQGIHDGFHITIDP